MTLEATPKNVEWLIDRLYECGRDLESADVHNPTFVLLVKSRAERDLVMDLFYHWALAKYGDIGFRKVDQITDSPRISALSFGGVGRIVLMQV